MLVFQPLRQRLRAATSPLEERPWHSGKAFPLRQRLPSVGELSSDSETERFIKNTAANVLLLGRMLPYPWCHLNYRQNLPVTLCALPVESTAAITSGARLPLLPAAPQHPGGSGGSSRGFVQARPSARLTPARTLWKRALGPYFSRSSLFLRELYHCFFSVSTSAQQFLQVCAACPS